MKKIKKMIFFFQKEIWEPRPGLSFFQRFLFKWLRILISSIQDFINDQGFDKASTLTFYSLLSIIPLTAIGFGIAKALGFGELFVDQIKSQLYSQPEVANKIVDFAELTFKTTQGGWVAGLGLFLLLWTVLRMIGNIASFFNEIWKTKNSRTMWQQFQSYLPMIVIFPIFLVGSNYLILYFSTLALSTVQSVQFLTLLSPIVKEIFHLISYLISWGVLSFIYIYLPDTTVSWKAGCIAGTITGLIYMLWQWIYLTFQANATSYGVIYGSLAAIPLFLLWLNYGWLIIIFGAELAYHIQLELKTK